MGARPGGSHVDDRDARRRNVGGLRAQALVRCPGSAASPVPRKTPSTGPSSDTPTCRASVPPAPVGLSGFVWTGRQVVADLEDASDRLASAAKLSSEARDGRARGRRGFLEDLLPLVRRDCASPTDAVTRRRRRLDCEWAYSHPRRRTSNDYATSAVSRACTEYRAKTLKSWMRPPLEHEQIHLADD
jgi:hypothetical protein